MAITEVPLYGMYLSEWWLYNNNRYKSDDNPKKG